MKNKGQIGTTITWAVAFFIILFLMVIFILASALLSGKGKNEISLVENNLGKLENQRGLMIILNTPLEDGKTIEDLIKEWRVSYDGEIEKRIETDVKKFLEEEKCYLFRVNYELNEPGKSIWINKVNPSREEARMIDIPEGISEIYVFSDNQKINVELSTGEC